MKPFVDCKYESIYNILKIYNKNNNLLNKLFCFEIEENNENILIAKNKGKVSFDRFLNNLGIKEKKIDKTKNLKEFLNQYKDTDKLIVIKIDLYYQNIPNKYYHKKHKRHNLLIKHVNSDNVEVIEHDFADSNNFVTQYFTFEDVEKWYYGYLQNYYDTKIDVADTIYEYSLADNKIKDIKSLKRIVSYNDEIKVLNNNIKVLTEYEKKKKKKKKMQSYINILNYKMIDKTKYKMLGEDSIEELVKLQINLLHNICNRITYGENYNELFNKYVTYEKEIIYIMQKKEKEKRIFIRYKKYFNDKLSFYDIKDCEIENIKIDSNKLWIDLKENIVKLNDIKTISFEDLTNIAGDKTIFANKRLSLEPKEIEKELNQLSYMIENINIQNNSINGYLNYKQKKFFYKILNRENTISELKGYLQLYGNIRVSQLSKILVYENACILINEYDENVKENEGLLNDFLVEKDTIKEITHEDIKTIEKVIAEYLSCIENFIISEDYPMQKFFKTRIVERLRKWYCDDEYKKLIIHYKNKKHMFIRIIEDIDNYFNKSEKKRKCVLTQGDPNSMNIGLKPILFDYATSGYNPLVAECATFLWSILFADLYFAPKYHRNSYFNHTKIFDILDLYNYRLNYKFNASNDELIITEFFPLTTRIRKITAIKFIETIERYDAEITNEIFYFLAMRVLCIFNINNMEEKDRVYAISFLVEFKELIYNCEIDTKICIKKFIEELGEL